MYEIQQLHRKMLKELFLSMDDDGSGKLEEPEIKMLAISLGTARHRKPGWGGQGREGLVGSSSCAESGAFGLPGQKLTQSEILAAMKEMDEDGDTQFILPTGTF